MLLGRARSRNLSVVQGTTVAQARRLVQFVQQGRIVTDTAGLARNCASLAGMLRCQDLVRTVPNVLRARSTIYWALPRVVRGTNLPPLVEFYKRLT